MNETFSIFDMDGTIVSGQSQQLFLKYLYDLDDIGGLVLLNLSVWFVAYKAGLFSDPTMPVRYALSNLRGWTIDQLEEKVENFFPFLEAMIFPEIYNVIRESSRNNHELILVSNALEPIARRVANRVGIHHVIATQVEYIDGVLTGRISGDLVYGAGKVDKINSFIGKKSVSLKKSKAFCDHISDLPVLEMVGYPVVVNPCKKLKQIALRRGWDIVIFGKIR